jgi:dihydrofolate reductase
VITAKRPPIYSMILATSQDGVLGANGDMAWHCPEDFKFFKDITVNHCMIMGRKTYNSLPISTLPNRLIFVVSSKANARDNIIEDYLCGVVWCKTIDEAIGFAHSYEREKPSIDGRIFIAGGAQIYTRFMSNEMVDEILHTSISANLDHLLTLTGDTTFCKLAHLNRFENFNRKNTFDFCKDESFTPRKVPFVFEQYLHKSYDYTVIASTLSQTHFKSALHAVTE